MDLYYSYNVKYGGIVMFKHLKDNFQCPSCHGELDWNIKDETDMRIVNADIHCKSCQAKYEVKDEIGMFLTPDLQRNDLWAGAASIAEQLRDSAPDILTKLMNTPEEEMSYGDLHYKAGVYEGFYDFKNFDRISSVSFPNIYTKEYMHAWESQYKYISEKIMSEHKDDKTIVDIACGRCYLVKHLLENTDKEILATDFSPTILVRDKQYFTYLGLYHRMSLVAFDGRRTPLKDNSISLMTSNVGIQNMENCSEVFTEMNRVLSGTFYSLMNFLPEDDEINVSTGKSFGAHNLTKSEMLESLSKTPLSYSFNNSIDAYSEPTPKAVILEGAGIDGLPVKNTTYTYNTVVLTK